MRTLCHKKFFRTKKVLIRIYCKSKSQGQWIFWSSTFARRIMSFYPILTLIPYFCSICYVFFKFIKICDIVCLFSIILAIWSYQLQNVIFAKNWKIKIAKNLRNRQTMTKFFTNSKSINKILKMRGISVKIGQKLAKLWYKM